MSDLMEGEHIRLALEVWKKTIDVQQHFNDLELRIRNFAITVLTAALGAAGLTATQHTAFRVFGITISSAVLLLGAGLVSWLAFYFMDRWWYHRLLIGAVRNGEALEVELRNNIPGIELTTAIRNASHFKLFGVWTSSSDSRIDFFYGIISLLLIVLIVVVLFNS
jgi:hypothetical protein